MKQKHLQHLYLRAGFGIGNDMINHLQPQSKSKVVQQLFSDSEKSEPIKLDLSELESLYKNGYKKMKSEMSDSLKRDIKKQAREKVKELNYAWIDKLSNSTAVLNEKMTLFWANVFVCQDNTIWHIQQYNNTLRTHALGNLRDFVKAIAKEPSMSKYLNNRQNVKESPNENFARELMELFTLGIGNYSEKDIKESARSFTGWSFKKNGDFFLRKNQHDDGVKTFLGKTGNFDGDDIIDIILDQKACSLFICKKIYSYFVNPDVDENRLKELSELFYKDYDIKKLMYHIFSSEWFYDPKNIGVKIKSPIELLVGIQKIVPVEFQNKKQVLYLQKMMGQILLYPPNVAGWKGDRHWIDSNTLMFRMKLASVLLNNTVIDLDEKGELEDTYDDYYKKQKNKKRYIKTIKNWEIFEKEYTNVSSDDLKRTLIVAQIDQDTEQFLSRLEIKNNKEYLVQLMSIPEYQLC